MNAVLIVEDNLELRSLTARILRQQGFEVFEANHGLEALELLTKQEIPIVLSDVKMPTMDGLQLLQEHRRRGGQSLFVLFSGDLCRDQINHAVPLGIFEFLEKGSSTSVLEVVRAAERYLLRRVS